MLNIHMAAEQLVPYFRMRGMREELIICYETEMYKMFAGWARNLNKIIMANAQSQNPDLAFRESVRTEDMLPLAHAIQDVLSQEENRKEMRDIFNKQDKLLLQGILHQTRGECNA